MGWEEEVYKMRRSQAGELVARCATLATLLEVSAYPKPGNVHRTRDLPETRYEQFLAGGVAIASAIRKLALNGFDAGKTSNWGAMQVGKYMLEATKDSLSWQRGGNVNLGIILLLAPMSGAAGAVLVDEEDVNARELRGKLRELVQSTTPGDAVAVYEAIRLAVPSRVLGHVDELDVTAKSTVTRIREEGLTLLDIFQKCAIRDSICQEWVSGFETTFSVGHPHLKDALEGNRDTNSAIVDTFLELLSNNPDSLITRKRGLVKAQEVSDKAKYILKAGGSTSETGKKLLWALDDELHQSGGVLNPGTTADLVAASIFVLLLEGWRP